MEKREIIDSIRRMAKANGGKAPGSQRFQNETGIGKHDWYPIHWLRWGDALRDAGYQPNMFSTRSDETVLIMKYIDLARELQRFPIEGDLSRKRKTDETFPHRGAFNTIGNKLERARKVLDYCNAREGLEEVASFCNEVLAGQPQGTDETSFEGKSVGYVYLIRHGSRREYKIGRTNNPVRREGEIGIELPQKGEPIHTIKTDDPAGIEQYWHLRFKEKRKNGEWFELTAHNVQAFKRWKRIY